MNREITLSNKIVQISRMKFKHIHCTIHYIKYLSDKLRNKYLFVETEFGGRNENKLQTNCSDNI